MIVLLIGLLLTLCPSSTSGAVRTGIDVLIDRQFRDVRGLKVVLVTHAAARASTGRSTAEEFLRRRDVTVLRLLAPEHGYYGVVRAGAHVDDDTVMGTPVLSLYGALRRPSAAMITDADLVVLDLQDIGSRSYTYISTMAEVMDACGEYQVPLMILDRPNPLGGVVVDGALPDPQIKSFVARLPVPYIHGLTMGELANMANGEDWLSGGDRTRRCALQVIECTGWKRTMSWEQTGLDWYPTSPNIPSADAARGYAVTGLCGELGLASIGIGTSAPFTMIGAPTFPEDPELVALLRTYGVIARRGHFLPIAGKFAKEECQGYHLAFKRDTTFKPFHAAMALIVHLRDRFPAVLTPEVRTSNRGQMFVKTSGTERIIEALYRGDRWSAIEPLCRQGLREFELRRLPYLMY